MHGQKNIKIHVDISLYFFLETHMFLEVLLYPCNPVFWCSAYNKVFKCI